VNDIAPVTQQLEFGGVHRVVDRTVRDDRGLLLGADVAVLMVLARVVGVIEGAHRVPFPVALDQQHDGVLDWTSA